nr:unnamed protein product [Callosobruchus chinensis]
MEQLYRNNPNNLFFLLGGSGYTLRPWLLTPLDSAPATQAEQNFDHHLKAVGASIERCNGVLKNRFRCLLKDTVLHYNQNKASKIINACVVLHDMCIDANLAEPELEPKQTVDLGIYAVINSGLTNTANPDLM